MQQVTLLELYTPGGESKEERHRKCVCFENHGQEVYHKRK